MEQVDDRCNVIRIATKLIRQNLGEIEIVNSSTPLCDFIVSKCTSVTFGVLVRNTEFNESDEYKKMLQLVNSSKDELIAPIIVLCIDEATETANYGGFVSWLGGGIYVHDNIKFRSFKKDSIIRFETIVKGMSFQCSAFPIDEQCIIKRIKIEYESCRGENKIAEIIYMRKISHVYKKSEDCYPNDKLDEIIYTVIKDKYRNVEIKDSEFFFNSNFKTLQKYNRLYNYQSVDILVLPNLSKCSLTEHIVVDKMSLPKISLELYFSRGEGGDCFKDELFEYYLPFENFGKEKLEIEKMEKTLVPISDYFI